MPIRQNDRFELVNNTMSSKAGSPSNPILNAKDNSQCNDLDSDTMNILPSLINESVAKKLEFVDKEKRRRSNNNRIYREKVKLEKGKTLYLRRNRLRMEKELHNIEELYKPVDLILNNLLNKELARILKFVISE